MDTTRLKGLVRRPSGEDDVTVYDLPDSLLLEIFSFLEVKDVLRVTGCCRWWREIGRDECLWRNLAYRAWGEDCNKAPFVGTWVEEYRRLYSHSPVILSEELVEHTDEIFHVAFSHDGKLFTTTGKDGNVKVWEIGCPTKLKYSYNLKEEAGWNYTRYSAFNQNDTNLLVSGLRFHCGWVAWFSMTDGFTLTWTDVMTPQGIRGAWLSNHHLLYGVQSDTAEAVSLCVEGEDVNGSHTEEGEPQEIQEINFDVEIRIQFLNVVRRKHMVKNDLNNESYTSRTQFNSNDVHRNLNHVNNEHIFTNNSCGYLLVFATGYCDALNQIGIKFVSKNKLKSTLRHDNNHHRNGVINERRRSSIKRKQNAHCDHLIDLHGQILGVRVSANSRYLVVNMRAWLEEPDGSDPYERPGLSKDMEVRLIDLLTLRVQPIAYTGHKAVTDSDSFCFCFGDANKDFVVCGSESNQAYLWDRHSGALLSKLDHLMAGVSAAAINPVDQELVVSVGDDQIVKVWRSRVKHKQFKKEKAVVIYNPSDADYNTRL